MSYLPKLVEFSPMKSPTRGSPTRRSPTRDNPNFGSPIVGSPVHNLLKTKSEKFIKFVNK